MPDADTPEGRFEVYSAKADGSDLRRLTTNDAYDAEATVSADGRVMGPFSTWAGG